MKKYFKHNIKNFVVVKNVVTIEYLELGVEYEHQPESHNFWELVYVDKGKIQYVVEGTPMMVSEGEVIFLSPNQTHEIHADAKNSSNIFVLCFDCASPVMAALSNFKSKLNRDEKYLLSKVTEETRGTFRMPFAGKLEPLDSPNLGGEQAVKLYLELFLITMLRRGSSESRFGTFLSEEKFDSGLCDFIISQLKERVRSNVSIEEICASVNYSKSYISKIFKQQTGKTIIAYFNDLKIDEAKKLIRETNDTMAKISDILGFSDPRYFNLLFKETVHMTPKQYKNSIRAFD